MGLHAQFALANRRAIADEIERLIALLDIVDGDCDLEDDDPAGSDNEDAEGDHGRGLLRELPRYGVDQSAGPINYARAERDHQAETMGLVRSPSGGWRHPGSAQRA